MRGVDVEKKIVEGGWKGCGATGCSGGVRGGRHPGWVEENGGMELGGLKSKDSIYKGERDRLLQTTCASYFWP